MFSRISVVPDSSVTSRTVARQAPLSMEFFRQEHWNRLSFPPPKDLPNPGIKHKSPDAPAIQVDSVPAESLEKPPGFHL